MPATGTTIPSDSVRGVNRLAAAAGIAMLLCAIAFGISSYMSWVAFTSSKIAGCGSGGVFDCGHVLTSKWSKALGLPVASWAAVLYAGLIGLFAFSWRASTQPRPESRALLPWVLATTAAVSAGGAALWFTGLQVFVLEHLCPWCLGAHTCGILLCILMMSIAPLAWTTKVRCAAIGVCGCVGLMTAQILAPAPLTYEIQEVPQTQSTESGSANEVFDPELFEAPTGDGSEVEVFTPPSASTSSLPMSRGQSFNMLSLWLAQPQAMLTGVLTVQQNTAQEPNKAGTAEADKQPEAEKPRLVRFGGGDTPSLNPSQWPIIGSPKAKYIFVEMFDYTCPHCRNSQKAIRGALDKYKDDLAIVTLVVPLSMKCNDTVKTEHPDHREACEIGKISIAVWRTKPEVYREFHEWLFTQTKPTAALAKAQAEKVVGADKVADLNKDLASQAPAKFIAKHVELYRKVGSGAVPKMLFPKTSIVGEITSPSVLSDLIQKHAAQ